MGGGLVGLALLAVALAEAEDSGGGASYSSLNNCTLTGNSAVNNGGGADSSGLNNCTLTGNWVGDSSVAASIKRSKQSGPTPQMVLTHFGGGAENSTLN